MKKYTLLIECADQKGLVHTITGVLLKHSFNVTSNDEYVAPTENRFFMRTEIVGESDENQLIRELRELLPPQATIGFHLQGKKDVVILVTKDYHCLGDLLVRNAFGDFQANIKAVIGNHEDLRELSERFNVPFLHLSHQGINRQQHEEHVAKAIQSFNPDYIVLAKYMRILSPGFVRRFSGKMVNIHHSFLPAFVGANPYRQAFDRGVKIIGATAHFVSDQLDEGPIIVQDIIRTDHSKDPKAMARAGRDVEKIVLARALKLVLEDRVIINGNKTVIFD